MTTTALLKPSADFDAGPLLGLVLSAQRRQDDYGQIKTLTAAAERVVEHARALDDPLLMAAGPLAERVIGAALLLAGGGLETVRSSPHQISRVLVVDVAVASALALEAAANHARTLGAKVVCGVVLDPIGAGGAFVSEAMDALHTFSL